MIRTSLTVGSVVALCVLAVVVAASGGYSTAAVLLGLNGVLISGYVIRHRMRSRSIYERRDQPGSTLR